MSQKYIDLKISDIARKDHSRVDPSDNQETNFKLYSFSAHDEGKDPDEKIGSEIGSSKYEVPDNCVLVTKLNPRIPRVWKINEAGDNAIASTEFVVLKPNDEDMLDYLYMILSSDMFFNKMKRITGGTSGSHQRVSQSDILEYEFKAPNTTKGRKKMSNLVNNIDRKIELNHKLAELLEETAHAIYESWFEAYEPYDIPDNQEHPEEFLSKRYGEICSTEGGGTPDTDNENYWGGNIEWLTPTEVTDSSFPIIEDTERKLTEDGLNNTSANKLDSMTPLLTSRATVGEVILNGDDMATNQGFIGIDPNDKNFKYFIYEDIKNRKEQINRIATGSTYAEISQKEFNNIKINVPENSNDHISQFNKIADDIYTKIHNIKQESQELEKLRDYLLPQLLNGEVIIKELKDQTDKEKDKSQDD